MVSDAVYEHALAERDAARDRLEEAAERIAELEARVERSLNWREYDNRLTARAVIAEARVAELTAGVVVAPTNLKPSTDPPAPGGPPPTVNAHAASEAECMALAKRGTYWRDERERIGVQLVSAVAERDAALARVAELEQALRDLADTMHTHNAWAWEAIARAALGDPS